MKKIWSIYKNINMFYNNNIVQKPSKTFIKLYLKNIHELEYNMAYLNQYNVKSKSTFEWCTYIKYKNIILKLYILYIVHKVIKIN